MQYCAFNKFLWYIHLLCVEIDLVLTNFLITNSKYAEFLLYYKWDRLQHTLTIKPHLTLQPTPYPTAHTLPYELRGVQGPHRWA